MSRHITPLYPFYPVKKESDIHHVNTHAFRPDRLDLGLMREFLGRGLGRHLEIFEGAPGESEGAFTYYFSITSRYLLLSLENDL